MLSYSPTIKATADGSGCSHPHRESFKDFILQQGIPWGNSVPCAAAFLHINIFCNVFQSFWISPHSPQMAAQLGIPDFLPQVFVFSVLLPHPPCLPPSWNKEFRSCQFSPGAISEIGEQPENSNNASEISDLIPFFMLRLSAIKISETDTSAVLAKPLLHYELLTDFFFIRSILSLLIKPNLPLRMEGRATTPRKFSA